MTTTTTTAATSTVTSTSGTTFWRTVGWWAFWVAGVLLLLVVVPIKYNWGAVPAAFLAVVVLALASGLWGIGFIGRKTIIAIATIVTIVAFASFFVFQLLASLPKTAKRLPEVVDLVDTKLAAIGTTDTTSPDSSDTTAATPPATASDVFIPARREPVTYNFGKNGCVDDVWLEGDWVSYPQPLDQKIWFYTKTGKFLFEQGAKPRGSSLEADFYRVCRAPGSHATGVQIWP